MHNKYVAALCALLLGAFGIHRFYLRQYKLGLLYFLFFWTFIPTFISIVDCLVFLLMSKERFDAKYNSKSKTKKVQQYCANCKQELKFLTTPNFGGGKLNDETRVCRSCFGKMCNHDHYFSINSKKKYSSQRVRQTLGGINKNDLDASSIGYHYYSDLKDSARNLQLVLQKLLVNNDLIKTIEPHLKNSNFQETLFHAFLWDCYQLFLEIWGVDDLRNSKDYYIFALISDYLNLQSKQNILDWEIKNVRDHIKDVEFRKNAKEVIRDMENHPSPIVLNVKRNEEEDSSIGKQFPLANFLVLSENEFANIYTQALYHLAKVIEKENHSEISNSSLKNIHQKLTNPLKLEDNSNVQIEQRSLNYDDAITSLNKMIGLESVKKSITSLVNLIKVHQARKENGLKVAKPSYHLVFTGNPGTGKTTVARIVAQIYKELGILTKGQLIETDRSGLIGQYVGQTAPKVNKIVDKALGGVLFIDEAYALVSENSNDYGNEAVATLIKRMEDQREDLVVILAGYQQEMKNFIRTNPGIESRFNRYISFQDYDHTELLKIFETYCVEYEFKLTDNAKEKLNTILEQVCQNRDSNFGNGRYVRNLFEVILENQATRLSKSRSSYSKQVLSTLVPEDIPLSF